MHDPGPSLNAERPLWLWVVAIVAGCFAVPAALGLLRHFDDYRAVGKISASLFVAFSAGFLFLSLLRFTDRGAALLLTMTYALGTSVWVIASQAMWQHGSALFCLSLAVWAARETPSQRSEYIP
jgi:chromate transport protein ChrA